MRAQPGSSGRCSDFSLSVIVVHTADLAYRAYGPALATGIAAGAVACAVLAFVAAAGGRTAQVVVGGTLGLAAFAVGIGISGIHITGPAVVNV
jgi:hypothetical protein